jgi:endonuclease YncB( thermonuclease family)
VLAAAVALAVASCGYSDGPPATDLTPAAEADPAQPTTAMGEPEQTTTVTVAVVSVADGDTVDVSSGETVRLIGIDAPEVGECGHQPAADRLTELVLGKDVTLVPGARDDVDRYGRLLRYVDVGSDDAGAQLLREGLAVPATTQPTVTAGTTGKPPTTPRRSHPPRARATRSRSRSRRMNATRRTTHAFPSSAMSTARAGAETARSTPEESGSSGRMSTTWTATATASAANSTSGARRAAPSRSRPRPAPREGWTGLANRRTPVMRLCLSAVTEVSRGRARTWACAVATR